MLEHRESRTQAERREDAEQKILMAAVNLLVERGYDGFTLADVGERAGYSRGLPAHYYGKKEALLAEVARFLIDRYLERITKVGAREPGLPDVIARIRAYAISVKKPKTKAMGILLGQSVALPELRRTILELNARAASAWATVLQHGIDAGNIRPDIDVRKMAGVIYSFLRGLMMFGTSDPHFDALGTTEEFIRTLEQVLSNPAPA